MKYLSLFSGIGGFELGIQQAYELSQVGTESKNSTNHTSTTSQHGKRPLCIGFSEIDKYATQIYQSHFPNHKNYGDITKINADELPDFDLLVGGFPCQSFSIAGSRKGFDDVRGTMFFEIVRILQSKLPRLLLLENVKGLLSHDSGRTFRVIIATLTDLGYDLQWQVLNSKNHGVPQNRERVFIIGHLRGTSRPEVFPFGQDSGEVDGVQGQCSNTLTTRYYGGQANGTYITESELNAQIDQLNKPKHSNDRVYGVDGLGPTLNTMQGGNRQPYNHVNAIRRLTPTECERLQGFPDGWTSGVSDSQRYKCLGNAVTVNVIKDIYARIF